MKQQDHDEMARAWIIMQKNWWAYDALNKLTDESPYEAWTVVLRRIELSESENLLEDIGAGPLGFPKLSPKSPTDYLLLGVN